SALSVVRQQGLNTLCASALELPVEDNQVDLILCLDLIEHVKEDYKLVKEISRVLKKEGKVILTTPMQNGLSFPFLSREEVENIEGEWSHVRKGYSLNSIEKLFENNNLVIEKTSKYLNYFSRFAYSFNRFSRIPIRVNSFLYLAIIRLEPYIKYGAEEHIIIGKKV
ncbi:MAG: class I SAM-dependent methyltransferase, partial [Thermodesulfobacteriota bacterium]